MRLRRFDGVSRWHIRRAVPVKDPAGLVTRWVGTDTDIQEQKESSAALVDINAANFGQPRVLRDRSALRPNRFRISAGAALGRGHFGAPKWRPRDTWKEPRLELMAGGERHRRSGAAACTWSQSDAQGDGRRLQCRDCDDSVAEFGPSGRRDVPR
jgi:hypothetical protein